MGSKYCPFYSKPKKKNAAHQGKTTQKEGIRATGPKLSADSKRS
jgi:hypothetical protein